jgi:transcriptional regulator with XRE-family HTH domain
MRVRSIPMVLAKQRFLSHVEQARIELNLTQADVEELAGYRGYKQVLTGRSADMQVDNFLRLCNLLDLDPRDYFELAP